MSEGGTVVLMKRVYGKYGLDLPVTVSDRLRLTLSLKQKNQQITEKTPCTRVITIVHYTSGSISHGRRYISEPGIGTEETGVSSRGVRD